jgi:hypothetical protein
MLVAEASGGATLTPVTIDELASRRRNGSGVIEDDHEAGLL